MSILTGKEALIALANDQEVEYFDEKLGEWVYMDITHHFKRDFRLKPRTITLNNIEVPAPFEPKEGDIYWHVSPAGECGYKFKAYQEKFNSTQFGAWRTESEIRQVVAALRQVFGGAQ